MGGNFNEENSLGDVLFRNKSVHQPLSKMQTPENIEEFKSVIKNLIASTGR